MEPPRDTLMTQCGDTKRYYNDTREREELPRDTVLTPGYYWTDQEIRTLNEDTSVAITRYCTDTRVYVKLSRDTWESHFQKLALPMENEKFDSEYKDLVDQDVECIESICEMEERHITPITEDEVHQALNRLKNNKAVDSVGLCSEHLMFGGGGGEGATSF